VEDNRIGISDMLVLRCEIGKLPVVPGRLSRSSSPEGDDDLRVCEFATQDTENSIDALRDIGKINLYVPG
jgi:hypothetical protein